MDRTIQVEKLLRCRKCFRTGTAKWEVSSSGTPKNMKVLVALSDGFHRRARFPLNLPRSVTAAWCSRITIDPDYDYRV
jgi:hypothetical protein